MSEHRKYSQHGKQQQGAVAIIVAICLTLLVGMLGLVLDLGHLYVAKTELQNAADSASLSGAKELNGRVTGINSALTRAIEASGKNNYDLNSNQVVINTSNVWVGSCPSDGCMVPISSVTTDALAADKTFVKVDTGLRNLNTWFIQVLPGVANTTQTFGLAVAGRYTIQITPMGVCTVDKARPEQGFLRGVAYNIPELNPLSNGDPVWINPIDSAPGPCNQNSTSANNMAPFVCTGKSTTVTTIPGLVWVDTGQKSSMEGPLNSRFGLLTSYTPPGNPLSCNPETAPADTNVREYRCTKNSNPERCGQTAETNLPKDWMDPTNDTTPTRQGIEMTGSKPFNYPVRTPYVGAHPDFSRYGVLWSYSKEIKSFATTPYTAYGTSDWLTLYGGEADPSYPVSSPYVQFVQSPTGDGATHATAGRRVLNLVIIDCDDVVLVPGQSCRQTLPVLAIGKFFMQRQADLPGDFVGEFAGMIAQLPPSDIRLYR